MNRHDVNGATGTEDGVLKFNGDRAKNLFYSSFKAEAEGSPLKVNVSEKGHESAQPFSRQLQ